MKTRHIRTHSFVDDQLTCCPSVYFVSKSKSQKYVFIGKQHVIYHDVVQEIKFKHTVKSVRHIKNVSVMKDAIQRCPITARKFVFAVKLYITQVLLEPIFTALHKIN